MSIYLQPQDDGLPMAQVKWWTAEKLHYVTGYLSIFITSMRTKPWRAVNYIDLFAGPGKCQSEDGVVYLGSPLVALTARFSFDHYFFVDEKSSNIEALRQRCAHSVLKDRINYWNEDCNKAVNQIVTAIESLECGYLPNMWSSCLNFAFLDPCGLELDWQTVEALASLRTDLIIHYSQMGLQRYMPIAIESEEDTRVDRFFGTRAWRDIYLQQKPTLYGDLARFYKQNLCQLGYADVRSDDEVWRAPMMRNSKSAPLYRLIFASKSDLGEKFWRDVTQRDVYGQGRLF